MIRRHTLGTRFVVSICSLVAFVFASSARADYDPIGSGQTRLTLGKDFLRGLKANGVKLSAVAPAHLSGAVVTMPAVGGKFDPVAAAGTVESEGSLILSAGGRQVPIKALKLRTTQRHSPFIAKVGGSQLKIATATKVTVGRSGFSDTVSVTGLALSQTLATRLGKKLDLRSFFKAGQPLGNGSSVAIPSTTKILEKGAATLTLDPGLAAKLQSLFVAVNPIFPAEHQGPVFTLPIFGGDLAIAGPGGRLETLGELEFLQLGGGQVFWREPWVDLDASALNGEVDVEPSPPYTGKAGRLTIGPGSVTAYGAEPKARTVSGALALALDPTMARTFDETFARPQGKQSVFVAGEPLGTLSFPAQGQ
jgi:hypothetical protein